MSYETEIHKLRELNRQVKQTSDDVSLLVKTDLILTSENYNKYIHRISLIKHYDFQNGIVTIPFDSRVKVLFGGPATPFYLSTMYIEIDLPNFPSWCIPFTKIVPKAYASEGYDLDQANNINTSCKYFWITIDNKNYKIGVYLFATAQINYQYIPFFIDLDLIISNENSWIENNPNKI